MEKGQIVEHKLSKDWMMVLEVRGDKVLCRTKDLQEVEFYAFELKLKTY